MAPTSTRTHQMIKWQKVEKTKQKEDSTLMASSSSSSSSSSSPGTQEAMEELETSSRGCCTPKGKRFRIPDVSTCPSAPKKRRVMPISSSNTSKIAFFASPDIELFFFSALRNVSA